MSDTFRHLVKRFELRSLTARLRLERLLHRQQHEDAVTSSEASEWLAWLDRQSADGPDERRRRVIEQSDRGAMRITELRQRHASERREAEAEWVALDETTRLLNRVASRRARRVMDTGGEE